MSTLADVETQAQEARDLLRGGLGPAYVEGSGALEGAAAFIMGAVPKSVDAARREAFSGTRGLILRELMGFAGLDEDNAWMTNILKFRPVGNRVPEATTIDAFKTSLNTEWRAVGSPRLIIPIGNIATGVILGTAVPVVSLFGKRKTIRSKDGTIREVWPMVDPIHGISAPVEVQYVIEKDWERLGEWRKANG